MSFDVIIVSVVLAALLVFVTLKKKAFTPAAAITAMWLCGINGDMLISLAICASAPVAAVTTMFSSKYNRDTELSVNLVSLSTLLSLITMPVMIVFAEKLAVL